MFVIGKASCLLIVHTFMNQKAVFWTKYIISCMFESVLEYMREFRSSCIACFICCLISLQEFMCFLLVCFNEQYIITLKTNVFYNIMCCYEFTDDPYFWKIPLRHWKTCRKHRKTSPYHQKTPVDSENHRLSKF